MSQIANSIIPEVLARENHGALEMRMSRAMIASVSLAVVASTMLLPWRVTTGLMLGGLLSLFNFHWLQSSVAAVFDIGVGQSPRVRVSRYFIRYLVVGAVGFTACKLDLVSLPALFAGLCAFVPALFVEAFRQFYFAFIRRKGSF
jgi:hypothetical protein